MGHRLSSGAGRARAHSARREGGQPGQDARRELISRDEAQRQASYLVTALRQKMLLLPARISRKLDLDAPLRHKTKLELDAAIHTALDEFGQLPDAILQSGYDHYRAERAENGEKQPSEPPRRKTSR